MPGCLRLGLCLLLLMPAWLWAAPEGQAHCQRLPAGAGLECIVSAGSIEHDLCCRQHPAGRGCDGRPGDPRHCTYEWSKAQERMSHGLYWTRRFRPGASGRGSGADFAEVCAPAGTVLAAGDERWCCARAAAALAERDQQGVNKLRCR